MTIHAVYIYGYIHNELWTHIQSCYMQCSTFDQVCPIQIVLISSS